LESNVPRVYRIIKKDDDGLPNVGPRGLDVRRGVDIDLDAQANVIVNGKGMSVAPSWRDINVLRIPKRLRGKVPGANGSNSTYCFRSGDGPFQQGAFAAGLTLEPDSPKHGNVAPEKKVSIGVYEADLAATRSAWVEDEN
ncbi:MAG: hypothetical protein ACREHD_05685, partial [Pirellulales bacterium]